MMARVRAPEFPQNRIWLNTNHPLALKELKGRVVILDFWTYCCINCLHVLPDLKYLEQKYKDSLTVIGIHSAKFENEKEIENIRQAILRYDIEHPVMVDNDLTLWDEYAVRAWPTLIVIDPESYVVAQVGGEGHRESVDSAIAQLLEQHQNKGTIHFQQIRLDLEKAQQPLTSPLAFPGKVLAQRTSKGDRLFIADSGHHRIIVTTPDGEVLHIIGTGKPGLTDNSFEQAQFFAPQGMAYDDDNQHLYVADTENHAIRRIDFQTQQVETLAGTGKQSRKISPHQGLALETALNSPWDIQLIQVRETTPTQTRLYIAMAGSHQIWEMRLDTGEISTYAGTGGEGCKDGELSESAFAQPSGLSTNGRELFVADSEISSIRGIEIADIVEQPKVRTICGSGELFGFGDVDSQGTEVRLQHCLGVEYAQNYLWVADTYNHKIKRVDHRTGRCETILGEGKPGNADGIGIHTRFCEPSGVSSIASTLFIADTNNHAIRKVELDTLTVTTLEFSNLCAPDICLPSAVTS